VESTVFYEDDLDGGVVAVVDRTGPLLGNHQNRLDPLQKKNLSCDCEREVSDQFYGQGRIYLLAVFSDDQIWTWYHEKWAVRRRHRRHRHLHPRLDR
jgi:hypothetical protein